MAVKNGVRRALGRVLRNRVGTAEIVGSVMFLLILLFVFTNVYLWHDQATRQMDNVLSEKMNSLVEVSMGGGVLAVTNNGGVDVELSRLWIVTVGGEHVYADLENVGGGLWIPAGATLNIMFSSASPPYVSPVGVSWDVVNGVAVVAYAPGAGDTFKVLTTLGNTAACVYG